MKSARTFGGCLEAFFRSLCNHAPDNLINIGARGNFLNFVVVVS